MRLSKKILSIILALLFIFCSLMSSTASAVASVSADTDTTYYVDDYAYIILADGTAELIDYSGDDVDVVIPSSVNGYIVSTLGKKLFYKQEIESVIIPEGVTKISDSAFDGCKQLKIVNIPSSVKIIGEYAFYGCSMESIVIPDGVIELSKGEFGWCTQLKSVTIPNSVKFIGDYAFSECYELTKLTIPNGVEIIGEAAFNRCEKLSIVSLPESVTIIEDGAFLSCENLKKIVIPPTVVEIQPYSLGYYSFEAHTFKVDNFKIYGYTSTAGEEYAIENEFKFIPLDKGDADESTSLDINDVTCMQKIIAKINSTNDFKTANCDLNGDGKLNIRDATLLQLYLANKIDKFPVQE